MDPVRLVYFLRAPNNKMGIFGMSVAYVYFGIHLEIFGFVSDMLPSHYIDINRTVLYIQIKFRIWFSKYLCL
jgi:hypothetical protein